MIRLSIICISFAAIHAAGPVLHAYLAQRYLKHHAPHYSTYEKASFIRGTLFPDIRYVSSLSRSATHTKEVSLDAVTNERNPFRAGMLFHSYVDQQREQFAQEVGIYDHLTALPTSYKATLLKVLEDELVYPKIDSHKLRDILRVHSSEEGTYGLWIPTRMLWHRLLRAYLKDSPLTFLQHKVSAHVGLLTYSSDTIAQAYKGLVKYHKDALVKRYVEQLLMKFEATVKPKKA